MQIVRIILLLWMTMILLFMAACPAVVDHNRERAAIIRNYLQTPNEKTKREYEEARAVRRRKVLFYEILLLGFLGACVFGFVCAGKRMTGIAVSGSPPVDEGDG